MENKIYFKSIQFLFSLIFFRRIKNILNLF